MDREEVFPGYTTLIERGKHEEYLRRYGEDVRAIHQLYIGSAKSIYRILTQGLMCTTERYSRGVIKNGLSSTKDMETGGGDSVFTRIASKAQRERGRGTVVVFKPEVFDRTDWYSYGTDRYGSTSNDTFNGRLSPDTIFAKTTDPNGHYLSGNEQMFRTGIGARFVEHIEVDPHSRDEIITELRSMGLEKIDGRTIEEIIVSRKAKEWEQKQVEKQEREWEEWEQKQAEKQAKMQALISGEKPYTSVYEMMDLADAGDDFSTSLKSMIESVIAQGGKEQLSNDMSKYIKREMDLGQLKAIALDEVPNDFPDEDKELLSYLQSTLGINYGTLYEEALAPQPETTPETSSSEPELTPTPTPPPEPPSNSVDG